MEIYLKKVSLTNFKGIKNQSFDFENRETTIVGANGTGKTSLFDAFVWALFGKDHLGRSDHQLKTFEFAKNEAYESRINEKFKIVKFKLFKQQVDGQVIPDCECMANGVHEVRAQQQPILRINHHDYFKLRTIGRDYEGVTGGLYQ